MTNLKVYEAIAKITDSMSKHGISKDKRNQQQGYSFRGIDDVYNALSPMLAANKLCILPRMIDRELIERVSSKGGALFYVTVRAEFDFVSAEDGSKHTVTTYGEAMDSADKATNKAMSAAFKYAAFQAFCIPTEGDNDADSTTHEVAPQVKPTTNRMTQARKLYSELFKEKDGHLFMDKWELEKTFINSLGQSDDKDELQAHGEMVKLMKAAEAKILEGAA
jgi:hypothetical protein